MIRVVSVVTLLLLVAVSTGLYKLKYQVQLLNTQATNLQKQILAEREAIRLLEADWAYLNQPDRLQALAERHLTLAPIDPKQFVGIEAVPPRLLNLPAEATIAAAEKRS